MKKDFFSGWTAVLIVFFGIFILLFAVQQIVDSLQGSPDSGGAVSGSTAESFQASDKPIGQSSKPSDKKFSELTENIAKNQNLSGEEKKAIVEQKMAEGTQAMSKKDFQAALKIYNEWIEINPQDENAHKNRGDVYQEMKNYNRAVENYNEAIEINSDFAIAYCSRGSSYIKLGNYEQAIKDLNKAVELQPDYADAYKNLSVCYRAMGESDTAKYYSDIADSLAKK